MTHKLTTSFLINLMGEETELELQLEFKVHPGSRATQIDPEEYTTAELADAWVIERKIIAGAKTIHRQDVPTWLWNIIVDSDEIQAAMLQEYVDDCIAEKEYQAESRADYLDR